MKIVDAATAKREAVAEACADTEVNPADVELSLSEGQVVAGKYRVERVLGTGGMGLVVAAQHLQLGRSVALKIMLLSASQNEEAVARFWREARASAQITSEHIARVLDIDSVDGGAPFIVMEMLDGVDLQQLLQAQGSLAIEDAVGYVLQACEAIAEAHALGIVHRDLKPANLFLTRRIDGSALIKVLDFGISKAPQHDFERSSTLTQVNAVMGSPHYMSPEQVRSSKNVDAKTDIWALGMILHELLAGAPMYQGESYSSLFAAIAADPPVPLRAKRPDAPAELEAAILACVEKDPALRMSSVANLARALAPFAPRSAHITVERILGIERVAEQQPQPQLLAHNMPVAEEGFSPLVACKPASDSPVQARITDGVSSHSVSEKPVESNKNRRSMGRVAGTIVVGMLGLLGGAHYLWSQGANAAIPFHEASVSTSEVAAAAAPPLATASVSATAPALPAAAALASHASPAVPTTRTKPVVASSAISGAPRAPARAKVTKLPRPSQTAPSNRQPVVR
jgi:serine/threonine-protein kinase